MIFLLLSFIFNPFGFALRWLPALHVAAWPVILQTLGREALITHTLILILFILVSDVTRATMLRFIGFDLVSLPAGIGLIALLYTDKGFALLSLFTPIINGLMLISEPALLIIETIIVMEFFRAANKWISKLSNLREDSSQDLGTWEPPLTRTSIVIRFVVILITIASYLGTYVIIQESKTLLNYDDKDLPIQFNHAIALLVSLQTISFFATIYKDEGILSETALAALLASIPIFIAAWSFNHLNLTEAKSSDAFHLNPHFLSRLSLNKLAKFYFEPDFWYILLGRLVCLVWWRMFSSASRARRRQQRWPNRRPSSDGHPVDSTRAEEPLSLWTKLSGPTSIKILFVVAYAQMLIQRTENQLLQTVTQRLVQSIFVHIYYLFALLKQQDDDGDGDDEGDDEDE